MRALSLTWLAVALPALMVAVPWSLGCTRTTQPFPDSYVGVGVELTAMQRGFQVVRVLEGGPAAVAGVKPGATFTAVDGEDVAGMSLAAVVTRLRGPPGSTVTVRVAEEEKAYDVTLVRAALKRTAGSDYRSPISSASQPPR